MSSEPKPAAPEPKEVVVWSDGVFRWRKDDTRIFFERFNPEVGDSSWTILGKFLLTTKSTMLEAILTLHARIVELEAKLAEKEKSNGSKG